jgi:hypothetical protein
MVPNFDLESLSLKLKKKENCAGISQEKVVLRNIGLC